MFGDTTAAISGIVAALDSAKLLIFSTSYIVGFVLCIVALKKSADYAESPQQVPFRTVATLFIVGVLCLWMPTFLDSMLETLFKSTDLDAFSYSGSGAGNERLKLTMSAIIYFVQIVGLVGFFKGIILLKNIGSTGQQGDGAFAKAMTHLIGGAMAINIVAVVKLFAETFGMNTSGW